MSEPQAVAEKSSNSVGDAVGMFDDDACMLVTMQVDGQWFGIPVENVQDVLKEQKIANIPLAPNEVAGCINLRGRVVTVVNLRKSLNLDDKDDDAHSMFVVVTHEGEYYSLIVDSVGEVMTISKDSVERSPANMSPNWKAVSAGICQLEKDLLIIIDIHAILNKQR